ncbi:membrane protein [Winogradskya consettensis]|uniref:Membrane protein n=1 Tax=Winogradskya consettensis TaxID=113560 RepID=A0A919T1H1_9ACTN|nr:membrane protein [Actinoplanes consettensis]
MVLLWVVVLGALGGLSMVSSPGPESSASIPGTESQDAFDLITERFPGADVTGGSGANAKIVFVAPQGQKLSDTANKATIEQVVEQAGQGAQVAGAGKPVTSADGSTAYATITYTVKAKELTDATKQALEASVRTGQDAGLTIDVGGNALAAQPSGGFTEIIGIVIAAVVLLVTFGSLVAAGMPLLSALIGVGVALSAILCLASTLGLSTATSTLALMLGLAVGIDYAVFIVSRYREERARGREPEEAAGLAVGTAGSAVVFAGLTVVIGLAGLSVVGIPTLTQIGLAAAGAVLVSVIVALTLVPALLGTAPRLVLARSVRRGAAATTWWTRLARRRSRTVVDRPNRGSRWARLVLRHPLPILLLAVVGLAVIALPATKIHLGMAGDESKPTSTGERRAYDDLANGFGAGFNGPLTIVVDAQGATDPKAAVAATAERIAATTGIVSVSPASFNQAGDTALFTAVPFTAPNDDRTVDLIHVLRDERPAIDAATGTTFFVTGATAGNIDSSQKVLGALVPYLGIVVGLAFLLLMVVFRSVLVPLKAALGFLLSVLAALGAVVAVFQWGWLAALIGVQQTGPIMNTMPIVMVGIVFGLAMDYEVFLVARIREAHTHGENPRDAIVSGFNHSARVVVAAALIMIAVFSGFVGAGETFIKTIGFGMAIAVLFDAFVVRMTIVPAALALLGERAWWLPRWLDRILPHVDIEGQTLTGLTAASTHTGADDAARMVTPAR